MITEDKTKAIVTGMMDIFPNSTPRVNAKAGGGAYGITTAVPVINPENFKALGLLIEKTEAKATLKRSGAGLSILIN